MNRRRRKRAYLLPEKDVFLFQDFREHERLLVVHVIVQSAVYQIIHLVLDVLDLVEQLALLVTLQIVGDGWQTHEPLGVNRICNQTIVVRRPCFNDGWPGGGEEEGKKEECPAGESKTKTSRESTEGRACGLRDIFRREIAGL